MQKAVNSLVIEILKSPLFLIFVLIGIGYVIYAIFKYFKNKNKDVSNTQTENNICPKCGGSLILREGKYGKFYGCTNYPKCKFTKEIDKRFFY